MLVYFSFLWGVFFKIMHLFSTKPKTGLIWGVTTPGTTSLIFRFWALAKFSGSVQSTKYTVQFSNQDCIQGSWFVVVVVLCRWSHSVTLSASCFKSRYMDIVITFFIKFTD